MISTKCQYHEAVSKWIWWIFEKWFFVNRIKHVIKKINPIFTCDPWNPVVIKKIDPYTLSLKQNVASKYSIIWRIVKYIPRIIVNKNLNLVSFIFSVKIE